MAIITKVKIVSVAIRGDMNRGEGTHQNYITGNKTQNYLDEFVFRYNRRKSSNRGLIFQRVMEQVANHPPIKYTEVAGTKAK